MSYIETVPESEASGELGELYRRFGNGDGSVDNVLKVHSLNPPSLAAHCALYTQSMHRPSPVSRAEREMVGVAVSRANGCAYCLEHHAAGLERLLPEDRREIAGALKAGDVSGLSARERAMVRYSQKLTRDPASMARGDAEALRDEGLTDREILDVCQAAAYFAYANRIVLGLGASLGQGEGGAGHWPAEG